MNNRTKLLTAAGSAVMLAGVGGALALWSDTSSGDQLFAATGHLNVDLESDANLLVADVSALCSPFITSDPGYVASTPTSKWSSFQGWGETGISWHNCVPAGQTAAADPTNPLWIGPQALALGTLYELVPGDSVRVVAPIDVDLAGQNIAAQLSAELPAAGVAALVAASVDDTGDATPPNVAKPEQFTVTPVGIFSGGNATTAAAAANNALTSSYAAVPADLTYYFVGVQTSGTVFAVFDIEFLDWGTVNSDGETGANDNNGSTTDDLQDLYDASTGVGLLPLISSINVTLTQVRS